MKMKIIIASAVFFLLQACGSKNMMHSEVTMDNVEQTVVTLRS